MATNIVALDAMATRLSVNPAELQSIIINTVMPNPNVTQEQFLSFLSVANEYKLNPLTKEIYAFPSKGGGIQPIVSIDGWLKIINGHPQFDGMEFVDNLDNGKLISVTCRIYRKDRTRHTEVTEYMGECSRNTDTWKNWPSRMLRHKATIQGARYAFGLSGIIDPDEAERFEQAGVIKDTSPQPPQQAQVKHYPTDQFEANFTKWSSVIQSGKKTAEQLISMIESKGALTEAQKQALYNCDAVDAEAEEV